MGLQYGGAPFQAPNELSIKRDDWYISATCMPRMVSIGSPAVTRGRGLKLQTGRVWDTGSVHVLSVVIEATPIPGCNSTRGILAGEEVHGLMVLRQVILVGYDESREVTLGTKRGVDLKFSAGRRLPQRFGMTRINTSTYGYEQHTVMLALRSVQLHSSSP